MLQHAIPPARFFSQTPNEIIRHPRLNGTAVRLLQWALSLPEGSRETIGSIGEKMPEGRIAVRNARKQLEAEGFLHTRRTQNPGTGKWATQVLVSNVALKTPEDITAAFAAIAAPRGRCLTVGEPAVQAVGASPKGENTGKNTPHPAAEDLAHDQPRSVEQLRPDQARAAALLSRLGECERRLRLGVAEAAQLAPLAAEWLARGVTEPELRVVLTAGLPGVIHAPQSFLAHRLRTKIPAPCPVADLSAPAGRPLAECAECRDPLPRGQSTGICANCAGVAPPPAPDDTPRHGAALVRAALRRATAPRPA